MYVVPLDKLTSKQKESAGPKGASLSTMMSAGIHVPQGFVVLAEAFDAFMDRADMQRQIKNILAGVIPSDVEGMQQASERIKSLICSTEMPPEIAQAILGRYDELNKESVAVRSSATVEDGKENAWAGQLDTYLNSDAGTLLPNVQKCWASLFNTRAILYGSQNGLSDDSASVAVVVQEMINAKAAGVAFSVHPITSHPDHIYIEAGQGLGEAVVSGQITPDNYVVNKVEEKIMSRTISPQHQKLISRAGKGTVWVAMDAASSGNQSVADGKIIELSRVVTEIESYFGFPVDVEWAEDHSGELHITQSRPITALREASTGTPFFTDEQISQDTYDFLWREGFSYLFCSIILIPEYRDRNFIACHERGGRTLFIAKKVREQLSRAGLAVYTDGFEAYRHQVREQSMGAQERADEFRRKNLALLGNRDLAVEFSRAIDFCRQLMRPYFCTEYHSSDIVAELLEKDGEGYDLQKLRRNVDAMAQLKFVQRDRLNRFFYYDSNIFNRLYEEISRRLPLSMDVQSYSCEELIDQLRGKKIVAPDRSGLVVRGKFSGWQDITGSRAQAIFSRLQYINKDTEVLQGNIGNPGYYQGIVKKIDFSAKTNFAKEIAAMRKGQVLVSGSTGPEMMLACKKAGAIVTEEGGIVSHAALVSRELNIPAVIGTKIATRVLKDGDLVEVDANTGTVRRLKG